MDIFEIAKTIGAISGFCSAAFLIWDRSIKHFPSGVIVARPLIEGSRQIVPFVHLRNLSDRPLLASWRDGDRDALRIARDQTAAGVVQTLFEGETTVSLGPNAEAFLPLFLPRDKDEIAPENMMELKIRWRLSQPQVWQVDRFLRISIRKRDLDDLIEGHLG